MNKVEDKLNEALKPGTACRKALFGLGFFVAGLLFVWMGFWQTLLVVALTLLGLYIGSSDSLADSIKKGINRLFPPKKKPVTYSAEDIQKVREAREQEQKKQEAQQAASGKQPEPAQAAATDEDEPERESQD